MIDCTTFGSTHVAGTLRVFLRFERWLEKSPKMTGCARFGSTHAVGTLRAFLCLAGCQERQKCSGVAQCHNFVYVLGTLCDFLPFKRCLEDQGFCDRNGYPGEYRGEYNFGYIHPEKPDISVFWIYHIISISSGIYGGYISDNACDIPGIRI